MKRNITNCKPESFAAWERARRLKGIFRLPLTADRLLAPLAFCALLAGCAVAPRQDASAGPEAECREVFRRVDRAVAAAGVADGIVPGSERGERWLFWPMGVPEPGAMRQWGRHATAFVGRRHFDDPWLFERYFALEQP